MKGELGREGMKRNQRNDFVETIRWGDKTTEVRRNYIGR